MVKKFLFLAGLPRSGSTLLATILSENPHIYSGGSSPVAELMWRMQETCLTTASEQLIAGGNQNDVMEKVCGRIPHIYYDTVAKPVVLDKCRAWCSRENISMINRYITKNPKIICMVRPVDEVAKSFVKIRRANNWSGDLYEDLLDIYSSAIMGSYLATLEAKTLSAESVLFVSYDSLVQRTKRTISEVYSFIDVEPHNHNLKKVSQTTTKENDISYGLLGLHDVREEISIQPNQETLPHELQKACDRMTDTLFENLRVL